MSKNRAWFLSWKLKESRWNFIKSDLNTYFNSDLVFWENNMLISRNQYTSHNERANKNASLNIDCHYVILLSLWENWTIENRFEKSLTKSLSAAWSINSPGQISLQKYFRKIWIYSSLKWLEPDYELIINVSFEMHYLPVKWLTFDHFRDLMTYKFLTDYLLNSSWPKCCIGMPFQVSD